jgi:hypothetical protein
MIRPRQRPRAERPARPTRRLRVRRVVVVLLAAALTAWLVGAARAPSTGAVERPLLWLLAVLLPVHVLAFQLDGIRWLTSSSRLPPKLRAAAALVALCASPMVLYPLGLLALAMSLVAGGTASPALAVTGLVMLLPIIAIGVIALMFIAGRYKGG